MKKLLLALMSFSLAFTQVTPALAKEPISVVRTKSDTEKDLKEGIYTIKLEDSSLDLDLDKNKVYLNVSDSSDLTKWILVDSGKGTFGILSFVNGQALTSSKKKNLSKAIVELADYEGKQTQQWKLKKNDSGTYEIYSVLDDNYVLSFDADDDLAFVKADSNEAQLYSIEFVQEITKESKATCSIDEINVDKKSDDKGNFHVVIKNIEAVGTPTSAILKITPKKNKKLSKTIYVPLEGDKNLDYLVRARDFNYESGEYEVECSLLLDGLYEFEIDTLTCKVSDAIENLKKMVTDYIKLNTPSWEEWQVYLRDLEHDKEFDVNSHPQQSASMIKMWVMGCVYENYDWLCEKYSKDQIDYYLYYMVSWSYNWGWMALTELLADGDMEKASEMVTDWAHRNGYMDVETKYELSHNYCSTKDASQMFKDVYEGKFEHSDDMMHLFFEQKALHKIPSAMPPGVLTANKTGDLQSTENDTCLVFAPNGNFIISIMATGLQNNVEPARASIRIIARMVYDFLNE